MKNKSLYNTNPSWQRAQARACICQKTQKLARQFIHPERDCSQFYHTRNNAHTGILLIHGIDDTAFLLQEYGMFLNKLGYPVYNITLPGRGQAVEKMANYSWQDWVNSAREDYLLLQKLCPRVIIAGFSTGATIALYLAATLAAAAQPSALILLSPALFPVSRWLPLPLITAILGLARCIMPYLAKPQARHLVYHDPGALAKYDDPNRPASTRANLELCRLVQVTRPLVPTVSQPCLIIQSPQDIVVDPYGAFWLLKKLAGPLIKIAWLSDSGHPVMVDRQKQFVWDQTRDFLKEI